MYKTLMFTKTALMKNTVKTVILWNIITFKLTCFLCEYIVNVYFFIIIIISVIKAVFSASLLQSSVSHDLQKSC